MYTTCNFVGNHRNMGHVLHQMHPQESKWKRENTNSFELPPSTVGCVLKDRRRKRKKQKTRLLWLLLLLLLTQSWYWCCLSGLRYRKVLSNNCKEGGRTVFSPRRQTCQPSPPQGLRLSTSQGELAAAAGTNVTFLVQLDQVRGAGPPRDGLYHLKTDSTSYR